VKRLQSPFVSAEEVRTVVRWWRDHAAAATNGDDGTGKAGEDVERAKQDEAARLLCALAAEVRAQEEGLRSAHVAFVRPGEFVAVRREHAERVLRRIGVEDPDEVIRAWRQAGWLVAQGDRATRGVRAPWGERVRMLVLDWGVATTATDHTSTVSEGPSRR